MSSGDAILNALKDWQVNNPDGISIPQALVTKMLETEKRASCQYGQMQEREELVCRLLASDMPAEEISLILKIRVEDIQSIERYSGVRIADYSKKLKARRKGRERTAANNEIARSLISKN